MSHEPDLKEALVSIVIPAYNVGEYIEECVDSIRAQTYDNLEIIVVDDGSTDSTYAICKKLASVDGRVRLIHQENKGVVWARQAGVDAAKGKFLSFVDGDDWIEPDMIAIMVSLIGDADLASIGVDCEEKKGRIIKKRDLINPGVYVRKVIENNIYTRMVYDMNINISHILTTWTVNKLYITDKVKQIHSTINPKMSFSEDAVFVYKYMLQCKKIAFGEDYCYHYRYRADSALHKKDLHRLEKINLVYSELYKIFEDTPAEYRLLEQLNCWLMERCYIALNEHMGIDRQYRILRYMIDVRGFEDNKIIIYGAGRVGQDIFFQLKKMNYNVVLWCDARYEQYRLEGMPVLSPDNIVKSDFDLLVIAVESEDLKSRIKKSLKEKKISLNRVSNAAINKIF